MTTFLRAADFWLCVAATLLMLIVEIRLWRAHTPPGRLVRVGFTTLIIAAGYGFGASPHPSDAEIIFRYLLATVSLLYLVTALTWLLWRQWRTRGATVITPGLTTTVTEPAEPAPISPISPTG